MNTEMVARELCAAAREMTAVTEWPTEQAMNTYLKKHPSADKSNHKVKKETGGGSEAPAKSDGGGKSDGDPGKTPGKAHEKKVVKPGSVARVKNVMSEHKLKADDDEMKELAGFKSTLGQRVPEGKEGEYYVRNVAKLKADFIKNMSPSNYPSPEAFKAAKERMKKMPQGDFGKILAAITDEED